MAIKRIPFDNEMELDLWVQSNHKRFFGDVLFFKGNFLINTKRKKGSKPDGFILDLNNSSWTIIEAELLKHGVWDHIAEQIIRFIVAANNNDSQRKIRDLFFNEIEKNGLIQSLCKKLNLSESRLIQKIENILESQTPEIAIFIDDINEDLEDMVEALNTNVKIYKIEKFEVNGKIEYHPVNEGKTIVETSIEEIKDSRGNQVDALDSVGGGNFIESFNKIKIYKLNSGEIVSIKFSKRYPTEVPFWYGIKPSTFEKYQESKVEYILFILGEDGVIKLPIDILSKYLKDANTSLNGDGSIKHFHIFIKDNPEFTLMTNKSKKSWNLTNYFFPFE